MRILLETLSFLLLGSGALSANGKQGAKGVESGVIIQRGDLDGRISASEADYVFVRTKLEPYGFPSLSATFGLGRFNTDIKRPGISAIALLTYTGKAMVGPAL